MPDMFMLLFILIIALIITGMFAADQWKHYRIRRTGRLVQARIIQVSYRQNASTADFSLQTRAIPLFGEKWEYELLAEWTDPGTEETLTIASGRKRGVPRYQQGDLLAAYVSPTGNYLVL
jgi:hypothetical protein